MTRLLWLERAHRELVLDAREKIADGDDFLLFASAPDAKRDRIGFCFALTYNRHVGDLVDLAVANAVVQGFGPLVEVRAHSTRFEPLDHGLREILDLVGDRNHAHLLGREPEREG